MTEQEIFNIVWTGMASQGWKKSHDPITGRCLYRQDDGCKCAVGWLVPDDVNFTGVMNSMPVRYLAYFVDNYTEDEMDFIHKLQRLHDGSVTIPMFMERSFRDFAEKNGLEIPE